MAWRRGTRLVFLATNPQCGSPRHVPGGAETCGIKASPGEEEGWCLWAIHMRVEEGGGTYTMSPHVGMSRLHAGRYQRVGIRRSSGPVGPKIKQFTGAGTWGLPMIATMA